MLPSICCYLFRTGECLSTKNNNNQALGCMTAMSVLLHSEAREVIVLKNLRNPLLLPVPRRRFPAHIHHSLLSPRLPLWSGRHAAAWSAFSHTLIALVFYTADKKYLYSKDFWGRPYPVSLLVMVNLLQLTVWQQLVKLCFHCQAPWHQSSAFNLFRPFHRTIVVK